MKYIRSFFESNTIEKESISLEDIKDGKCPLFTNFLDSIGVTWVYDKNASQKANNKTTTKKGLKKISEEDVDCKIDIRDDYIYLYFKSDEVYVKIFDEDEGDIDDPDSEFRNKFRNPYHGLQYNSINLKSGGTKKLLTFTSIHIPKEKITDYISKYKEDIEDFLIYFEDVGYKIYLEKGYHDRYGYFCTDDDDNSNSETSYDISIMFEDDDDDENESNFDSIQWIERLKKDEDFIKKRNIYSELASSIKRIQSIGLKVEFVYDRLKSLRLAVFCKEDKIYNRTTLL